jgi:hypothetical protein
LRAIIEGDERAAAALASEHVMRAGMDFIIGLNTDGDIPLLPLADERSKPRDKVPQKPSIALRTLQQELPRPADKKRRAAMGQLTSRKRK